MFHAVPYSNVPVKCSDAPLRSALRPAFVNPPYIIDTTCQGVAYQCARMSRAGCQGHRWAKRNPLVIATRGLRVVDCGVVNPYLAGMRTFSRVVMGLVVTGPALRLLSTPLPTSSSTGIPRRVLALVVPPRRSGMTIS